MSVVIGNIVGILIGALCVAYGLFALRKPQVLYDLNERYSKNVAKRFRAFMWRISFGKEPKNLHEFRVLQATPFGIMFVLFGLFLIVRCFVFLCTM